MNYRKIIPFIGIAVAIISSFLFGLSNYSKLEAKASECNITLANINAFMQTTSLDCEYKNTLGTCNITVGAHGKIKLLGGTILEAGADGKITIDGRVTCDAGGTQACTPIECLALYTVLFSESNL